jgi:hypothetical protein
MSEVEVLCDPREVRYGTSQVMHAGLVKRKALEANYLGTLQPLQVLQTLQGVRHGRGFWKQDWQRDMAS